MRQIKFRVWDGVDFMSKPFTLHELQAGVTQITLDCTVMQYTGLKDSNGKEIYEGDFVRMTNEYENRIGLVAWGDNYPAFDLIDPKTKANDFSVEWNVFSCDMNIFEVIGNIYENPELLEQD